MVASRLRRARAAGASPPGVVLGEHRLGEGRWRPSRAARLPEPDPQRHERHVEPRRLHRERASSPTGRASPARRRGSTKQHEGDGQEARRGERQALDGRRPPRLGHLHHAGERGPGDGEARPEEQVDEVDAPRRPRVGAERRPEEGDDAERGQQPRGAARPVDDRRVDASPRSFLGQRPEVVHHVPPLLGGERLAVGRHHGAARPRGSSASSRRSAPSGARGW